MSRLATPKGHPSSHQLHGAALRNYLSFRHADCVGADPAYAPLLEELRRRHPADAGDTGVCCRVPLLMPCAGAVGSELPPPAVALIEDVLSVATGINHWPTNGMLSPEARVALALLCQNHRRHLFGRLGIRSINRDATGSCRMDLYRRLQTLALAAVPRIGSLPRIFRQIDAMLRYYQRATPGDDWLVYRTFPCTEMNVLVQPMIDCCLFNGRSRHRAATVAFLAHPHTQLMALWSTRDATARGTTIEADMLDEQGRLVRVLDSVEMGSFRHRLEVHYGWIQMVVQGVVRRAQADRPAPAVVFFNTGYDERFDRGYLSHEAAGELALWLKARFPVVQKRLALCGGLEPLRRLGAVDPKINLEVLSTKVRNDMFNDGVGMGVGVAIDLSNPEHLVRLRSRHVALG